MKQMQIQAGFCWGGTPSDTWRTWPDYINPHHTEGFAYVFGNCYSSHFYWLSHCTTSFHYTGSRKDSIMESKAMIQTELQKFKHPILPRFVSNPLDSLSSRQQVRATWKGKFNCIMSLYKDYFVMFTRYCTYFLKLHAMLNHHSITS